MAEDPNGALASLSDEVLVWRAARGSVRAWGVVAARHLASLTSTARGMGVTGEAADELAVEALERAYAARGTFDADRAFGPWLRQILRSTVYDCWRRRRSDSIVVHEDPVRGAWWLNQASLATTIEDAAAAERPSDEFEDPVLQAAMNVERQGLKGGVGMVGLSSRDREVLQRWAHASEADERGVASTKDRTALHRARQRLAETYLWLMRQQAPEPSCVAAARR